MSYNKSCNVDVLKTFDLRVRPVNNVSPGLYSTLAAGPQQVYGSPLTWEYILLISDVQNIKVQHSTIISNDYLILSTNVRYISTYLDNNISTLSSYLYTNYKNLENTNVYLQGTLLYNVSNYYEQTNSIRYPSSLSTIISNYSTLSTVIYRLLPTLTYLSTTSTLYKYEISTIQTLNNRIQPLISTLSSYNINYSTILYRNLNQSESNIQSTVSTSIYNYLLRQSTTFSRFESILSNTSSYLFSSFSTQYFIYSTINGTFLNENVNTVKTQFSSLSSIIGYQYSSVDELYNKSILGSISTAQVNGRNAINSNLQTITSSISNTYSTLSTTIGTQQNILNSNTAFLGNLQKQYSTYKMLSTQVLQLSFYSTISRPQTFFEIDFYLNNIQISTYYWHSSIGARDLQTNQSIAAAYLESQYNYNSSILSSLFASNTSNAYYNIIKAYRANNIPLIDRISNSIPSTFINPSLISTAYGQYSTQVRSSVSQTYKIVIQSERLAIRNTSNVFITATQLTNSRSSIVGSAFISLSNEMRLLTSTSFNNLISYTFGSFRSNSELTLRILNQAESANNSILSNYITNITDHTIQDSYYYNLSTLFYSDFSTTKGMLTSTTISHLNNDSTFIIYLSSTSSLSTFYYSNISSFLSTLNYSTNVYSISSLSSANAFNLSTLSSFNSYLGPITSSISTYLTNFVYSTLSSSIDYNYLSLSNVAEEISSSLFSTLYGISNKVDIFNASQGYRIYSSIILCNAIASNALYNVYCNSINLSVNQIVLSTFTTISSIYVNAPMTMFEGGAKLVQEKRSPLQIEHYDRAGVHNLLYVNPTKNEVVVNNLVINGNLQLVLSNTVSTLSLDLNKYQNFYAEIQTMSNANPTIELNVNLSTNSKYTQQGYINININPASANEIAAKRFLNIINLGPTIRLNITNTYGYLRYKYLSQNGKVFISQNYDFTKTTSSIIPAGNVNTITNTNNANFIGLVSDSIGNLYATDINTNAVLKYDITNATLNIFVDGFNIPYNLTIDNNNNLYVTSFADNTIYKVTPAGVKTPVCTIPSPIGIVVDLTATYLYVSSLSERQIYQVGPLNGTITITAFAGSGAAGYADGIGTAATFGLVFGMTIDSSQTLYVTDYGNNSIRKIVISTKLVTTLAGSTSGLAGNTIGDIDVSPHTLTNGAENTYSGTSSRFNKPTGIIADNLGNLFVCDSGNYAIRRIIISTGDIITISGVEGGGYLDGLILEAKYTQLYAIVINAGKTNLYVCDLNKIRQVGYNINAITGNSASQINANTVVEAATRYAVTLLDSNANRPVIMNCVVDSNGQLFLLSATGVIYKYNVYTQSLTVFATLPTNAGYGLTIELFANTLYATDGLSTVYEIDPPGGTITVVCSNLNSPKAITVNNTGTKLYVGCPGAIFELTLGGITTESFDYTGSAQTWTPTSGVTSVYVILNGAGAGCYADYSFNGSPGGTVSGALPVTPNHTYTIVVGRGGESSGGWWTGIGRAGYGGGGNGAGGQYGGSGGGGRSAIQYTAGTDIVTAGGGAGSYYYTQGGVGGDVNGGGATNGTPYQGDDGPYNGGGGGGWQGGGPGRGGTSYIGNLIAGLATAGTAGNGIHANSGVYGNGSITIITGIKLLAGRPSTGYLDGIGLTASLDSYISGIIYNSGILYFSEFNNQIIRKLAISTSNVVTVSGIAGTAGSANGLGKNAQFNGPRDIKTDLSGNLYVSDLTNNAIRKIDIGSATVTTLIGNMGYNSYPSATNPDGILNQAQLFGPYGISFDNPAPVAGSYKNLYVIDANGQIIRNFYKNYASASLPMSTIVYYDNSSIFLYKSLMSSIVIQTSSLTSQTYNQYLNTLTAYNNTLSAPPSAQKSVFVTSASNAVLNTITQSNLALNASTITSVNYLSVITISTLASAQFTTISYNANVYLSNVSNLYIESQCNSNTAYTAFQSASASAATASDAYTGAVNAATQSNIEVNYAYTGSDQSFTVPAGVTKITVELLGAGGSTAYTGGGNGPDAQGGYVFGDLAVIAGQTYTVVVGGQNNNGYAQYGGGGAGSYSYGGSGGGRSALVLNGSDVVTAGGGGGDAYYTGGGQGGGLVGQNGYYGAGGGSQTAGGAASGYGAQNGYYQNGGYGSGYGAGGGGGYYGGGGGGGWSYGGGGGSSYVALLTGTVINTQGGGAYAGYHASQYGGDGHGRIKITYSVSTGGGGTTPFLLTFSGCVFWFDASDSTTITASDGYSVSSWTNKGSTGGAASVGAGTPLTNTVSINGINAISFAPYTYMNFRSAMGGNPVTFFCVTRVTSDLINGFNTVSMLNTSEYGGFQEVIAYDGSTSKFLVFSLAHNVIVGNSAAFSSTNISNIPKLYTQRSGYFSGNSGTLVTTSEPLTNLTYVNGTSCNLQSDYNTEYQTASVLYTISASFASSQDMGEMLLYNRALTASEIAQINSYLITKWAINLPSIDTPLITWFDGNYGLTTTSWKNRGTNGGSATLSGVTITTQNNLNAANFTDANSYGVFTPVFTGNSRAVFAVYKANSTGLNKSIILISQVDQQGPYWYVLSSLDQFGTTNFLQVMAGNQLSVYSDPAVSLVMTNMAVVAITYDENSSANSYVTYNGNVLPSLYYSGAYYFNNQISYLNGGGNSGGAAVSDVGITLCELLIYDGVVSPANANKIQDYLGAKWGLTLAPNAPSFVSESITSGTYNMAWQRATTGGAPTSYSITIQRSANNSTWTTVATHTVSNTTDTYSSLTADYYYRFSVSATNSIATSSSSSPSSGVQYSLFPDTPISVSESIVGSSYNMSWQSATTGGAPTSYIVSVQESADNSNWTTVSTQTASSTSDTYNFLTRNYYYRFRVFARNASGDSSPTSYTAGVQKLDAVPGTPTSLSESYVGYSYSMSWAAGSGGTPTSYTVTVQFSPNNIKWIQTTVDTVYTTTDSYNSVNVNYRYRFSVVANNGSGSSSSSGYTTGIQWIPPS